MDPIVETDLRAAAELRRRRLAAAGMVFAVLLFGSNFVISRHAVLHGMSVYDIMAVRFGTAGLLLLPLVLRRGLANCSGVGWGRGLFLLVSSGFPMSFLMLTGLSMAPAAHGATITPGTVTMIGIVGSVTMFGAAISRNLVIGTLGMLAGLACLAIAGSAGGHATVTGDLLFFCCGLLWGFYPLMIQRWRIDGLHAAAIVSVLSLVYLPLYFAFFFRGFEIAPWQAFAVQAVYQGVLNMIVALWLWGRAAHVLGAAVVGRFPPLIPVTGTALAIPVLGEWPGPIQWIGIALIISGLFVASWRRPARQPKQDQVPQDRDGEAEPERRP
ncbi:MULTISPECIES: DMT family transporter [unclassified Bosea (in: a-proteobacteria)]|uniref:DMT family transporter n=1 Tax=unclassified Bosea (in: a-proteobacteria) TaxID=2653178 RepID=UPI0009557D1C|nr:MULTISPECIES: DMT family transporter [unclassified Bosea (in: a-proteobacteria)]SIP90410.1 Permease of the drug/metabolite transporter (DMT) superfamily [Bosea sp. TND4EK4]